MILVYAFSNQWGTNISRRTLTDLQILLPKSENFSYRLIGSHPKNFFEKYIKNDKYKLIVGLGDFWGSSQKIRIETWVRNVYGQESINPLLPIGLEISMPDLEMYDPEKFIISENMGTYNCNLMAFLIQADINRHQKETRQMFFHIPKKYRSQQAAELIGNLLKSNRMLE